MSKITILGRKINHRGLVSDFDPSESDKIMLNLASSIKDKFDSEVNQINLKVNNRLQKIKLKSTDGKLDGEITHLPVDVFGERNAEVRTVLNIDANEKENMWAIVSDLDFSVALTN